MEDQVQIITIPVRTDIDPATLLEIAISLIEEIEGRIDAVDGSSFRTRVLEEEISVEDGDDLHGGE